MRVNAKRMVLPVFAAAVGFAAGAGVVYKAMSGLGSPGHEVQRLIDEGQIRLGGASTVLDGMKTRDDGSWERRGVTYEVRAFTDRPRVIVLYIRDGVFIAAQAIGDGNEMWLFMDHDGLREFVEAVGPKDG